MQQGKPLWRESDIAYCANVHPGTKAENIESNIVDITAKVREAAAIEKMAAGLWICEYALEQYQSLEARNRLRQCLTDNKLSVVTFNGFPQGDFHQAVVKDKVYKPNWHDAERLSYTRKLAELLAFCMPEGESIGSISTLPIAYKQHYNEDWNVTVCQNLYEYALYARELALTSGKHIRLCLEMEPGCVLEKTPDAIDFFQRDLVPYVQEREGDDSLVKQYLGLCYDICHQAVMQEDIAASVAAIDNAGIVIGKVQVSSALSADLNAGEEVIGNLKAFAEPKYLHQVSVTNNAGAFLFADDLIDVLDDVNFLSNKRWFIHYHLPLQAETLTLQGLSTTRPDIEVFLDVIQNISHVPHVEIETYTWQVLPENQRPKDTASLIEGLCAERSWLAEAMRSRGLI